MKAPNERLKKAREGFPLTQEELAEKVGASVRAVRNWEAGQIPGPIYRRSLCKLLNKDPKDLGFIEVEEQNSVEPSSPLILLPLALVILALIALIGGLIGFTFHIFTGLTPRITQPQLNTVDWNNFTYPGLCNSNQRDQITVNDGTAIDSGLQGKFFVQVYSPTLFGDLTGDGQSEAIVPYGCSDTDPNSPIKGTVYVHVIIFSGNAVQHVVIGQFPALSGQANRDFASVDFLYIDHGALRLIGEGFSRA